MKKVTLWVAFLLCSTFADANNLGEYMKCYKDGPFFVVELSVGDNEALRIQVLTSDSSVLTSSQNGGVSSFYLQRDAFPLTVINKVDEEVFVVDEYCNISPK